MGGVKPAVYVNILCLRDLKLTVLPLARIIRERSGFGDSSPCCSTFNSKIGKLLVLVARGEGKFGVVGTGCWVWARCPADQVAKRASRDETTVRMSSTGNTKARAI